MGENSLYSESSLCSNTRMSLRESAVSGIEGLLKGRFPEAAVTRGDDGRLRDNISAHGINENVEELAADVRVVVDSAGCVAFKHISSETISDDYWKLSGMLTNGEAPCATITITYIRGQTKLLVSLVWIARLGEGLHSENRVHTEAGESSVAVSGSSAESLGQSL